MQRGTDGPKKHAEWTRQNRHQVLFTDECCMCLQPGNRRRRVWRQSGQAECLRHTVQQVQQGGCSLMFLGGILWGRRTPLVVMEGARTAIPYRNDMLRLIVQQYRQNFGEEFVLIDDNFRPHRAHLVNEFLHDNIARLEWSACSLDMNPIEHAWNTIVVGCDLITRDFVTVTSFSLAPTVLLFQNHSSEKSLSPSKM